MALDDDDDTTMTIHRPSQEEKDTYYKPGSIKRVKLTNFLTYDAVEFFPGPRLNVVVGPNGTGKSTILCAICLGLGGQPPLLGRADDARLFIKHEKDEASIEIELAPHTSSYDDISSNKTKNNGSAAAAVTHVIRRVIHRNMGSENGKGAGASTYYINGNKSNLKNVKELVSDRYHIHIDNLCTFLPQDKVGSFSGFDKQSLLHETEKALSSHLYQTHLDLMDIEKSLLSSGVDLSALTDELAKLRKENERLEREKELMEERATCLERIDILTKKRLWLLFDIKREETKAIKERREELKKLKKEADKAIRPLVERLATVEGEHTRMQSRTKAVEMKLKKDKISYDECIVKCDNYTDDIEKEISEYRTIDAQQRKAERDVEKERLRLEQIEQSGQDYPPIADIERTIKDTQREMISIKSQITGERSKLGSMIDRIEDAERTRKETSERLDKLQDDKKLRLSNFCRMYDQVGQAYKFIDENRKMFRHKVWGPIAAEVQPENQLTASYLENHVSQATWKSFIVECKEDYDLLYREVREKRGIPINIMIGNAREGDRPRMYSTDRMAILKREHGFLSYLDETFTAPDIIKKALISKHNVDKVLVGGEAVHTSLERKDLIEFLSMKESTTDSRKQASCFFYSYHNSSFKYTSQVSRYSGEIGTVTDEILPAKTLKPGSDPRVREELAEKIQKSDAIVTKLRPEVDALKVVINELNAQGQNVSQLFKDAKKTKSEFSHYEMKLKNARDKLEEAKENASRDNDREKAKKIAKVKKLVESSISISETAADLHNQNMKGTHTLTGLKMMDDAVTDTLRHLTAQLEEKQAETVDLQNQYKAADNDYNQKKDILKKLLKDAETIAPMTVWSTKFEEEDIPESLEGVDEAIDEMENKVSNITDNPHVMRQYEERKREISKLEAQLEDAGGEKDMKKKQLDQKLAIWEAQLTNIVKMVSEKFSSYMKEVGCAGEVRLYTGGGGGKESTATAAAGTGGNEMMKCYNFKDWGVEILVKFREASSLQVLSAQTHSGGERSVSTIMYLMGLQNLMSSPFRCVDEINQGLDERNERLVFKRIVENSTSSVGGSGTLSSTSSSSATAKANNDHCGQYFLITPKLLPNLEGMENENITVLFVFSGSHNFTNCLDWNVDKFVEEKLQFQQTSTSGAGGKKRKSSN